jgi:DNA polymerase (family 10)
VRAAAARGLAYVAITDHGQRVTMAHGLDRMRLLRQWDEIDRLNESLATAGSPPIVVLKGIEVDMLEKGGLDLPDDVLARADWVVASLHYGQGQPRDRITGRIVEAIENPHVRVIGHPTGRLINRRPPYDVDIEAVIEAAALDGASVVRRVRDIQLPLLTPPGSVLPGLVAGVALGCDTAIAPSAPGSHPLCAALASFSSRLELCHPLSILRRRAAAGGL